MFLDDLQMTCPWPTPLRSCRGTNIGPGTCFCCLAACADLSLLVFFRCAGSALLVSFCIVLVFLWCHVGVCQLSSGGAFLMSCWFSFTVRFVFVLCVCVFGVCGVAGCSCPVCVLWRLLVCVGNYLYHSIVL